MIAFSRVSDGSSCRQLSVLNAHYDSITNHLVMECCIPTVLSQGIERSDKGIHWFVALLSVAIELGTFINYIPAGYKISVEFFPDIVLFLSAADS